jgi:hypothetical protein
MHTNIWRCTRRALTAALLVSSVAACDFIEPTTADPNNVADAQIAQLFTGTQVNLFYLSQSIYARLASMWTQQAAGVTSQFTRLDQYTISEDDFDDEMASHYIGGGLVDIRKAIALADADDRRLYAGILKIHEAWYMGTAADVYGAVPYAEAIDPAVTEPALDAQLDVYAAVQAKLDEAIADVASGTGAGPGGVDLNFQGSATCWTEVAYSLKARYYMHTAEVDPTAYGRAATAAANGIDANDCNWRAVHSPAATETNIWHQFMRDRPDHIVAGFFLMNLLNGGTPTSTADDDPRVTIYFRPATNTSVAGQFIGSRPGSPTGDIDDGASALNSATGGIAAPGYDLPVISCWETEFIIAEAEAQEGDAASARAAADRAVACQENWFGITLPDFFTGLSGAALRTKILEQKYIAQVLNIDVLADYQRTCYPNFTTFGGAEIPGRFLYGTTERTTNSNIPSVGDQRQQTPRNANDPNPCT